METDRLIIRNWKEKDIDDLIKVWSFGGRLHTEFEHLNFVQSIEQLDANRIISASYDGTIKTWSVKEYKEIS
jgi:hypothetical protein